MAETPSRPQQVVHAPGLESNGLGIAGFVVSLVGLVATCGILCPIGLILSLVGLSRQPRGLAIAGTVLGAIGSAWMALFGFAMVLSLLGLGAAAGMLSQVMETERELQQAEQVIEIHVREHGFPPGEDLGNELLGERLDAWGRSLRYELDGELYRVVSAGLDGEFGTQDDQSSPDR